LTVVVAERLGVSVDEDASTVRGGKLEDVFVGGSAEEGVTEGATGRAAERFEACLAEDGISLQSEELFAGVVEQDDPPPGIDHEDRILDGVDDVEQGEVVEGEGGRHGRRHCASSSGLGWGSCVVAGSVRLNKRRVEGAIR
jgi:hypothetical protein